ncbi:VOC family protein [Streptomyces fenghuangensis]|uniref:VOC family protein n=1 Tax=Streptomyces chitinivorans TaxID=1257027 RepID=A0ABW7HPL0_9ACTN|nr:VOC family protein [Streptomyces chitinivorans]MDH2409142.1 VOC family protein [Streptomyces chitinivorans]
MPARIKDLVVDAADHQALADWWCAALGYERRRPLGQPPPPAEWAVAIHHPQDAGPVVWFNPVPDPKTGRNRVRFDVWGDTGELLALGATMVRRHDEDTEWDVLADPEGNEFGVFAPRASGLHLSGGRTTL